MADESAPGRDRTAVAVVVVAAVGLLARLVALDARPFHWDEARVGYWTLQYVETGAFQYRPVAGGPFLYVVGRHVLALVGTSDAAARLPVAVVSGLAPLVALTYRTRLDDLEATLLAGFLAVSPLVVYYGRFLRGDVPLATFALAAVGLALYAHDRPSRRAAYGAVGFAALAVTASGFVVATAACVLAAAALTVDHRRLLGRGTPAPTPLSSLRRSPSAVARAVLLAAAVVVFFYAPRAGATDGPGLWKPSTFVGVLEAVFVDAPRSFLGVRVVGRDGAGHALLPYLADVSGLLVAASLVTVALAGFGFLRDRYRVGESRAIVALHTYWGGLAVVVFAVAAEVSAPWLGVHVVAPLLVPAAVGLAAAARFGARRADVDGRSVAAVLFVALALVGNVGGVAAGSVYAAPSADDPLAQYGQPVDDLDPFYRNVSATADGEGVDVLYVGDSLSLPDGGDPVAPPVDEQWGERLPLPWYVQRAGATTDSVDSPVLLRQYEETPPVVVADAGARAGVQSRLDDYESTRYRLGLWNRDVVVFVRR
jgi:uncharacterized protein (TIGR03663 family)